MIFDPKHIGEAIRDRTEQLVGGKRGNLTVAVVRSSDAWLWCSSGWITPAASGSHAGVHVSHIGDVDGEVADVARELARRALYVHRVVINVEVPAGSFAPAPVSVVNLGDPKVLELAVQRMQLLFSQNLVSLPADKDVVEGLVSFDGSRPAPHAALVLLVALGYTAGASATASAAAPIEGGWVNGRPPGQVHVAFAGVGGPHDVDFDRRLIRSLFPPTGK